MEMGDATDFDRISVSSGALRAGGARCTLAATQRISTFLSSGESRDYGNEGARGTGESAALQSELCGCGRMVIVSYTDAGVARQFAQASEE